ncbi:type VI secretion system-associated FHA domain protein TagH [Oceanicella sp. SM1341]|uniref:type VI secretion system-associated FHA domain protein TagH n=1 Tax=Oceanicella sp. SM1341 TaxID=1548889 RepID=UPI000E528C8C|nr:type VI secretion system-associated FHA domain protein TagH [Oceanicella sp. SM1341]
MTLSLSFQNSGAQPGSTAPVGLRGGALTIGRGAQNDLALPDPDRTLSKRHCVIEARGGDYVILDLSTNGTFLNYGRERLGELPTPLSDGDVILLGAYELVVSITAAPDAPAAAPEQVPASYAPPPPDTSAFPGLPDDGGEDFLDALLGPAAAPAPPAGPAPVAGRPADSWQDPFAPATGIDPDIGLPGDGPGPEDALHRGASAADHAPTGQDHFQAPRTSRALIPDDWDDLAAPAPGAGRDPQEAPEPARAPHAPPPAVPHAAPHVPPPPAARPAAPEAPAAAPRGDAARAFLEAAGAGGAEIPEAELAETMARLGRVFAAMVAGLREILLTRAAIKSELRMERTMISQGGNNPMKFSISAEQAVEAMIRPRLSGYLDAEAAAAEALNDIRAHEVAMMSGMEAALRDLLARLGPDQLAARIETGSSLGSLLGGRKARYWEAYERMYAQIARETEDDFQSAFGREFARAYAEQLHKLEGK